MTIETNRKCKNGGKPHRGFLPLFLACLALCFAVTSCRTYVGSDDLYSERWSSPVTVNTVLGLERKQGLLLTDENDVIELQFAERSLEMRTKEEYKQERTGRKYYYYAPDIGDRVIYIVGFPIFGLYDFFSWTWEREGTHRPGILYQIAYFPFIKLFFQPILFSPSSFIVQELKNKSSSLHGEEVWNSEKTVLKRTRDIYTPVFETDGSRATITISTGDRKIEKALSLDGRISFSIADFHSGRLDPDRKVSFKVYHPKWKKTWIVETPAILDPEVIRDWNIFVDEQYDHRSRALALIRLKPVLGETACRDYFNRLLDGKVDKTTLPPMPTEIKVVPQK